MVDSDVRKYFGVGGFMVGRDTHIMFFKVPIMLCSNAQHHASLLEERGDIYPSNFMVNFR